MIPSSFAGLAADPPPTRVVGREIAAFEVLDSTNTYVLDHGREGLVVVADRQTAGRGRLGRTWFSAPGLGLWFTAALEGAAEGLTFAAALAVRDVLSPRCAVTVKWPNDLLIHGKKVCGILVEARQGRIALGIGLNVHHRHEDFPPALRDTAGSLATEAGGPWDRGELLRDVLIALDQRVMLLRSGSYDRIRREWAAACDLLDRRIRAGSVEGIVREIDRDGALILDSAGDLHRIVSGEIVLLNGG